MKPSEADPAERPRLPDSGDAERPQAFAGTRAGATGVGRRKAVGRAVDRQAWRRSGRERMEGGFAELSPLLEAAMPRQAESLDGHDVVTDVG